EAWNRLALGVRFVRAPRGFSTVQIVFAAGRCLSATAGRAPAGFQREGARVVVRSCPAVVRPLLVAHELGRVLGLANDDRTCSLMNSKGTSDGRTFALPARCSRWTPPPWLARLVDPHTAALARSLYAAPAGVEDVRFTAAPQPRLDWNEPSASGARRTVVLRTTGRCPARSDVAAGTAVVVYAKPAYAGAHWAVDTSVLAPGTYCYRLFNVTASGRSAPSAPFPYAPAPAAQAAVVTTPALTGAPVAFADRSTDVAATIVHWHWDFGDPPSGAADVVDTSDATLGRAPTHTYLAPGTYTVTLTVVDNLGRSATTAIPVTVGSPS